MAAAILSPTALFFLLILHTHAKIHTHTPVPLAPAPPAPQPINLTGILDEIGQFTTFTHLLTSTQVSTQVNNKLNSSIEGVTAFAPTDNAFGSLEPGTLNGLSVKGQIQLVMYHVLPKFYSWNNFLLVSNPVTTLATGQDGLVFCLNLTTQGNQFNVSSNVVEAEINNALRKDYPLAIYQVDKVLLPAELFANTIKDPSVSPSTPTINSTGGSENTTDVAPSQPSVDSTPDNGSGGIMKMKNIGVGIMIGGSICMGIVF